jgi:hypothetical protein
MTERMKPRDPLVNWRAIENYSYNLKSIFLLCEIEDLTLVLLLARHSTN